PVAALEPPSGIFDPTRLVVEDDDRRPARALVDAVDAPVEAHDAAVRQRDRRGSAGIAAEAERELACTRPGHDTERAADLLVRVEEALELPEDPPPVELPEQRPPGEAFALGRVAVPLADREEQRAFGVVPRLVGCGAGLDAVEELGEHVVHEAAAFERADAVGRLGALHLAYAQDALQQVAERARGPDRKS